MDQPLAQGPGHAYVAKHLGAGRFVDRSKRVLIERRPRDGQYFISTRIGQFVAKRAIEPLNVADWDRKFKAEQKPHQHIGADSNNPQPIGSTFSDLFMDQNELAQVYGHTGSNSEEQRRRYELRRMGAFAPSQMVAELVWCFPLVPPTDIRNWDMLPDEREWPVMVRSKANHYYPDDFRLGIARFWRKSQYGYRNDVFLVQKQRFDQLQPENDKYYGPAGGFSPMFQVPCWMIAHWRPMMVKDIDFQGNSVLFLRRGADPVRATVDEVRPNRNRSFAALDEAHQQMAVAMLDLYYEFPQQMRDFYDPSEEVATQEFAQRMEEKDNSKSEQILTQAGQGDQTTGEEQEQGNDEADTEFSEPAGEAQTPTVTPTAEEEESLQAAQAPETTASATDSVTPVLDGTNTNATHVTSSIVEVHQQPRREGKSYPFSFRVRARPGQP